MIFLDSNIVIDLIEDGEWTDWSKRMLSQRVREPLVANHIVFAEVSRAFASFDAALVFFRELGVELRVIIPDAAFRAGRAQVDYRRSGGRQGSVLADFLIGGHAASLNAVLVTRDKRRFQSYFPDLSLITPESHP